MKRKDPRPICRCSAYDFPHKIGGKCDGSAFTDYYFYNDRRLCQFCNCNAVDNCEVAQGAESIQHAECYQDFAKYNAGKTLPLKFTDPY